MALMRMRSASISQDVGTKKRNDASQSEKGQSDGRKPSREWCQRKQRRRSSKRKTSLKTEKLKAKTYLPALATKRSLTTSAVLAASQEG